LIGMALHFLSKEGSAVPGIGFSSQAILRVGVALLGMRISAGQIVDLGIVPVLSVVIGVSATIVVGWLAARLLGLTSAQGVLTGGAVGICGASAALAISAVLPKTKELERDTLFTVIAVTTLSTIAMVVYPVLVSWIGLDDRAAGILLGGTIHDVAQVVGAGYLISDEAGAVATYVKLMRVAMLIPVVIVLAWLFSRDALHAEKPPFPKFLLGFAALAALNSFQLLPPSLVEAGSTVSRWFLVIAISALGLKTSLQELTKIGWVPAIVVVSETLFLFGLVLGILLVTR
jgi:uncharacterized integral membrane protein (TIGR00698 family)